MNAQGSEPATRRLFSMSAPLGGLEQQGVGNGHRRLDVHNGAQPAGLDAFTKLRHLRMETTVVSEPERNAGAASGVHCRLGIALG